MTAVLAINLEVWGEETRRTFLETQTMANRRPWWFYRWWQTYLAVVHETMVCPSPENERSEAHARCSFVRDIARLARVYLQP